MKKQPPLKIKNTGCKEHLSVRHSSGFGGRTFFEAIKLPVLWRCTKMNTCLQKVYRRKKLGYNVAD
ncbi:hypothetical protein DXC51_18190 [Eisenbergiella massiliensis]|uniref:Uncharacterized protein n=1 Tax=Eisenbergiella massiliensis TaxID=1720294 RepID=A0A3E3I0W4_9FIRM|nr:hypothetical protein DXC51_18190 [Eisenbergiella massiliensis]